MNVETWIAFAGASAILLVIPGPTILLVLSYALGQGWRAALPTAIGVALGDLTAMSVSLLGLGTVLAASATLFTILKWVGAAYLIWLGIKLWRVGGKLDAEPSQGTAAPLRMIVHAWLVTALNPKSIVFFIAFVPQFLDSHAAFLPQVAVLEATFVALAFLNALAFAAIAARARALVRNERSLGIINKLGGSLLVGAGLAAVAMRPAQS